VVTLEVVVVIAVATPEDEAEAVAEVAGIIRKKRCQIKMN